ncbi:MAG: L,D-transpeptidase family protein [Rudaea sp.]
MTSLPLRAIAFAALAALDAPAVAAPVATVDVAAAQRAIAQELPTLLASASTAPQATSAALARFYALRAYAPAWLGVGGALPAAEAAVGELRAAPAHGLPGDGDRLQPIADALAAAGTLDADPAHAAHADIALSAAYLAYLTDLSQGRITAAQAGYRIPRVEARVDVARLLSEALASGRIADAVAAAEPAFPAYRRLIGALATYRALAQRDWPPLPAPDARSARRGDTYRGAALLRIRLRLFGDLEDDASNHDSGRYDDALADAVARFQARHGLAEDGVLGPATRGALDVAPAVRVRQIELSLERLRWLPALPPGPVVAINVPSYRLWAFDSVPATSSPRSMPVIVGRSVTGMQTPVFISDMQSIEFAPYWNVPSSIARNEIVPRLRRDPGYLAREAMEVVEARDNRVVGLALDEPTLARIASGALRLRQRPGPHNALGGIKFVLPNAMSIYLHATPHAPLFEHPRRDFSHGCIRVADPLTLAQFALGDDTSWTLPRMQAAMRSEAPERVPLPRPIPVVIFYTTAIVDDQGRAHFLPDIYGFDDRLERALTAARVARMGDDVPRRPGQAGLPAADAPGIDMHEIGRRVIPDAAGAKR